MASSSAGEEIAKVQVDGSVDGEEWTGFEEIVAGCGSQDAGEQQWRGAGPEDLPHADLEGEEDSRERRSIDGSHGCGDGAGERQGLPLRGQAAAPALPQVEDLGGGGRGELDHRSLATDGRSGRDRERRREHADDGLAQGDGRGVAVLGGADGLFILDGFTVSRPALPGPEDGGGAESAQSRGEKAVVAGEMGGGLGDRTRVAGEEDLQAREEAAESDADQAAEQAHCCRHGPSRGLTPDGFQSSPSRVRCAVTPAGGLSRADVPGAD